MVPLVLVPTPKLNVSALYGYGYGKADEEYIDESVGFKKFLFFVYVFTITHAKSELSKPLKDIPAK